MELAKKLQRNNKYWQKRNLQTQAALANKSAKEIDKQLTKYYKTAFNGVIKDFEATYDKLIATVADGAEPTPADLYKLDKYWEMQAQLKAELQKLGNKEVELLSKRFTDNFQANYEAIKLDADISPSKQFSKISTEAAREMISSVWVADGKSWSERIWDNTAKLADTLNEELIHCVVTGKKTTELKKLLQERFNSSYYEADRLARTEIAHIQTEAAKKRYTDYGVEQVEIWADEDERRCDVCGKLHKKRYPVGAAVPIPAHPNCRCAIIPVVDDNEPAEELQTETAQQQTISNTEIIQKENSYAEKTKELQRVYAEQREVQRQLRMADWYGGDSYKQNLLDQQAKLAEKANALLAERKELAKDIDPLRPHTVASVEVGELMDFEAADGGKPNPHYKEDRAYRINCQTCVVSYEARRRGYDVMATGNTAGSVNQQVSYNTALAWVDTETGAQPKYIAPAGRTAKQVSKWLDSNIADEGRYTIEFAWRGYRSGHIISVHKIDGVTTLYDPQVNEKYTGEAIANYLQNTKINSIRLLRVDTLEFNPEVIDYLLKASD